MIILKPICPASVECFKSVRLSALKDSPLAFGSTFARESQLSDAQWRQRVGQWNGERSICNLAWDGEIACGIVAGFFDAQQPTTAHLASMWVAPAHRGRGVGQMLVSSVIDWAAKHRAQTLRLSVTSNNLVATRFYERLGFTKTGETEPYPNDPALFEVEMIRRIVEVAE